MRTIEEHAEAVAGLVARVFEGLSAETLSVDSRLLARGDSSTRRRVLAADVVAPIDLPPFDNSQMDGYAVRSRELADGPRALTIGRRIPAGVAPPPLEAGTAAPIMTGAPIPDGADAVVQIEVADPPRFLPEGEHGDVVLPHAPAGQFVRTAGSDVRRNDLLFAAGTVLGPAHWGVLASAGVAAVDVVAQPRVAVVSTGSELRVEASPAPAPALRPASGPAPASALAAAEIHDANAASLSVALTDLGARVEVFQVPDAVDALLALLDGFATADGPAFDLVVTTGGVSAGAYEVVREALEPRGIEFGSVAMQPGGPQGWGTLPVGEASLPVVCFPGNPVSALISFEAFLRVPLAAGARRALPRRDATAVLAEGADSPPGKHQLRRARLDAAGLVHFVGGPSSHLLHQYAQATLLAHIPVGVGRVEAGDEVVVWALDD